MKVFTIDSDLNITAQASEEEATNALPPTGAHVFSTAAGLKGILKQFPAATAIDIWNGLTGVTPVKKFKDGATAAKRIFTQLQASAGSLTTPLKPPPRQHRPGPPAKLPRRKLPGPPRRAPKPRSQPGADPARPARPPS